MALPTPSSETTCVITGASSGIGADIARELTRRGHGVTLVARREERLRELAAELVSAHGIRAEVVAADVAEPEDRARVRSHLDECGLTPDVLVNNAGYGSGGRTQDLDPEREKAMVRLNVEALHAMTLDYMPKMIELRRGAILNVASTVAFQPLPRQATYSATKAFVLAFTEALHADLRGTGVTATALCPGVTRTEFFEVGNMESEAANAPDFAMMDSQEVALAGVDAMVAGRRSVVPGVFNQVTAVSGRLTPRRLLLPLLERVYPVGK